MGHEGIPRRQIGHFSLLRSYQLADLFTLTNAFAGMASILLMMSSLLNPEPWRGHCQLICPDARPEQERGSSPLYFLRQPGLES